MPRAVSFPFQDAGIQTNGTFRGIRTVELKKLITHFFLSLPAQTPNFRQEMTDQDDGSSSALNFRDSVSDF
jgi:hypothetical protein